MFSLQKSQPPEQDSGSPGCMYCLSKQPRHRLAQKTEDRCCFLIPQPGPEATKAVWGSGWPGSTCLHPSGLWASASSSLGLRFSGPALGFQLGFGLF